MFNVCLYIFYEFVELSTWYFPRSGPIGHYRSGDTRLQMLPRTEWGQIRDVMFVPRYV